MMLKGDTPLEIGQGRAVIFVQIQCIFKAGDALLPALVFIVFQAFLKMGKNKPDGVVNLALAPQQFVNFDRLLLADHTNGVQLACFDILLRQLVGEFAQHGVGLVLFV